MVLKQTDYISKEFFSPETKMDMSDELLSKIIGGDSSSKVKILSWDINDNIVKSGNNHTSVLSRLTVEYQRKGKIFRKSFILKVPSAHPMYQIGLKYKLYEKEFPVYADILEEMYKIDGEHIGPRLYYVDDKHSLILKDLSLSGYKMADRVNQLDYDQCYLVFKSLSKFHALSVKLEQMGKISNTIKMEFTAFECSQNWKEVDDFVANFCDQIEQISSKVDKLDRILPRVKNNLFQATCHELHPDNFSFCVLNHGDCWTGNTLFKFDRYGIVKKVKFIDFQRCHWSTPASDIAFFAITSMKFDVFEDQFEFLCKIYIESLNKMLHCLQCEPYTMEDLKRDFNNIQDVMIFILVASLPQLISRHDNPFDDTCIKDGKIDYSSYNRIYRNPRYFELLEKWMSRYEKIGKILI